ncbi:MAG: conjugal transfer protein TraF [Chlamydiae bacterium]|nr:conjugal transfer protein TraF [Chlamydiota bacterium]
MKFLSILLTLFIFCGAYASHDEKIAEEKRKKVSDFLEAISGKKFQPDENKCPWQPDWISQKNSRSDEENAVDVKKTPQEYTWQQIPLPKEELTSVAIDNNYKNTIKDKYYDENDLNRFMLRMNSDPEEVQRYNKLVEAGKKYILIVYDLPDDKYYKGITHEVYYFKRVYNWEVIGINKFKSDLSLIPTSFKDNGFHKTIDFKAFPTLILADPKRGIYRKIVEGSEYNIEIKTLEDLILKIVEDDK